MTDVLVRDVAALLSNVAQMLDEMKIERMNHPTIEWTDWNQQQRDELTRILRLLSGSRGAEE